jgi:dolichol-phosphate mannosyltransferase
MNIQSQIDQGLSASSTMNPRPFAANTVTAPESVSIVIPTFKEAENLQILLPRIFESLPEASFSTEVIVVDDDSRDGTDQVCSKMSQLFPVRLITRQNKRGLSTAVIDGMNEARGQTIIVMDADLSHPAEKIPDLVQALNVSGVDFVIGSRYVRGGRIDKNWSVFRWLNSKVATLLARPLTTAKDPMAGFFAIKRKRYESAEQLDPVGYKIGLELMVKCRCKTIAEVPIEFRDRVHGESKLSVRQQLDYLRHLKRLYEFRMGAFARPLQFIAVGATGMVVDLSSFSLLLNLLSFNAARAVAIWLAMTWNFWLNRRLTFSYARARHPLPQYALFCVSCLIGAAANWGVSVALYRNLDFFSVHRTLSAICGILAGTAFNFLLSDRLVFRKAADVQRGNCSTYNC